MVIKNKKKRVLVFKAFGQPVLRLLPGYNNLPEGVEDLRPYFEGNVAAQAMAEESLELVDRKLTAEQAAQAVAAKAKNDKLNKSSVLLKKTQEALLKAEGKGAASGKEVKTLKEEVAELKEQLTKALAGIDAQQKAMVLDAAKKGLEAAKEALKTAEGDWEKAEGAEAKKSAASVKKVAAEAVKTAEAAVKNAEKK